MVEVIKILSFAVKRGNIWLDRAQAQFVVVNRVFIFGKNRIAIIVNYVLKLLSLMSSVC